MSEHPGMRFEITGYRAKAAKAPLEGGEGERLTSGRPGHWSADHHLFPDGSFDAVMTAYPVGSVHDHVPPPPCRYLAVWPNGYDPMQEKAQLSCQKCYPHSEVTDARPVAA